MRGWGLLGEVGHWRWTSKAYLVPSLLSHLCPSSFPAPLSFIFPITFLSSFSLFPLKSPLSAITCHDHLPHHRPQTKEPVMSWGPVQSVVVEVRNKAIWLLTHSVLSALQMELLAARAAGNQFPYHSPTANYLVEHSMVLHAFSLFHEDFVG